MTVVTWSTGWKLKRLGKGWEGDCSQETFLLFLPSECFTHSVNQINKIRD